MTEIKKLKEKSTIDLNKLSSKDNILAIAKLIVFLKTSIASLTLP